MRWLFRAAILALFVYEFYALVTTQRGDTISEMVWGWSQHPLFPFAFGFLSGHLFWQRR